MKKFELTAKVYRKVSDPFFPGTHVHLFYCPVQTVPGEIPLTPNPRKPNVDRAKWKEIKKSLLNEDGTEKNSFHLKNKGITIIASDCKFGSKIDDGKEMWSIILDDNDVCVEDEGDVDLVFNSHGILDGGHTYDLIQKTKQEIKDKIINGDDIEQYVKIYVYTGISHDMISTISKGLNTGYEVREKSILNYEGRFQWIKDALKEHPHILDEISFSENEKKTQNKNKHYDIETDVVGMLKIFSHSGQNQPVGAYSSHAAVINKFKDNSEDYEKLSDILPDLFYLYELCEGFISKKAYGVANPTKVKSPHKHFAFNTRIKGYFEFPSSNLQNVSTKYHKGIALPMFASFRFLTELDPSGKYKWKTKNGFKDVETIHSRVRAKFWDIVSQSKANKKADDFGKDPGFWNILYQTVQIEYLTGGW